MLHLCQHNTDILHALWVGKYYVIMIMKGWHFLWYDQFSVLNVSVIVWSIMLYICMNILWSCAFNYVSYLLWIRHCITGISMYDEWIFMTNASVVTVL